MQPNTIIIPIRQREPEIDEYFIKSIAQRLIHPIVLRQTDKGPTLVVGARRLMAMKELKFDNLVEGEHFRFLHNLSSEDAEIVELEENVKREAMPWRDHVRAVARIHEILSKRDDWSPYKTAEELNISRRSVLRFVLINRNLDTPALKDAKGIEHAESILQVKSNRALSDIVTKISQTGSSVFSTVPEENAGQPKPITEEAQPKLLSSTPSTMQESTPTLKPKPVAAFDDPILCTDFAIWLADYTGPKFNLIHCDFPYNVDYKNYALSTTSTKEDYDTKPFDELLLLFTQNLDKFCSYQAHVVFWFSMEYYEQTHLALEGAGLLVHRHPFVWFKSDNAGIIPGRDNKYPRRVYETAFLCSRGGRPLVRSLANLYAAPTASNPIHPSQKSEPMLRLFSSMLIDETTDVLDPTCGSGAAIRAADSLGARRVLGLELDPNYARIANQTAVEAQRKRRAAQ